MPDKTPDGETPARLSNAEVHRLLAALDELLGTLEETGGDVAETALDAVHGLTELYGEALARAMLFAQRSPDVVASMLDDELLRHLFVLHGVHPDPVQKRVMAAIEAVRPYAHSHGGDIEFAGIDNNVVLVRLSGSCDGCASSAATLQLAVEDAVLAAAPELSGVRATDANAQGGRRQTLIPADALLHRPATGVNPQQAVTPA